MGWSFTHKQKGEKLFDFFSREFNHNNGKVLDCATKNMVAYIAYEFVPKRNEDTMKKEVIAIVCLLKYVKDEYNFGYKDMDESMGPCATDCPKRILDQLTPPLNEYAAKWREECRKNNNVKKGDKIRLANPLKFNDGSMLSEFIVESLRPMRFVSLENGGLYRMQRWCLKGAEVIE
jgi:hypothetical protein